jgi:hypothetical protein
MRFWPSAWLIVLALSVGGFAAVSALIAVKGLAEVKAILRELGRGPGGPPSPES